MVRIFIFAVIAVMIIFPAFVWAEDNRPVSPESIGSNQDQGGLILPETFKKYQESAENQINVKNELQFLKQDITNINYNKDGTINTVLYTNGTLVSYSYKYNDAGILTECALESKDSKIVFSEKGDQLAIGIYLNQANIVLYQDDGGNVAKAPARGQDNKDKDNAGPITNFNKNPNVVLYYPKKAIDLADLAKTPVKFDSKEIRQAIVKTVELKNKALGEYERNTAPYYERIENELKNKSEKLKSEKINISVTVKVLKEEAVTIAEKRIVIDEAVRYMHEEAGRGGGRDALNELLMLENSLRKGILNPAAKIYEGRIERALEYTHKMIDNLLSSKLAIYLNVKKDKIDAIINLPKNEDPKR